MGTFGRLQKERMTILKYAASIERAVDGKIATKYPFLGEKYKKVMEVL